MTDFPDDLGNWTDAVWHLSTMHDATRARSGGARQESGTPSVEDRLDRLALLCMAMWTLIQNQTSLTEEDLLARVREIDLMDGVADGKITRQVAQCTRCRRPMSSRHTRCIYCGAEQRPASAFDTV